MTIDPAPRNLLATAQKSASLVLIVGFLAGASSSWAQAPAKSPAMSAQPAAPTLNRSQVDALLAAADRVVVLDVRRADEISAIGGFPAYLNIQAGELESRLASVPKDRQIVPVSNHAGRALKAAEVLKAHGYSVAGVVGAQDYEAQGGRLFGKKPALTATAAPTARVQPGA